MSPEVSSIIIALIAGLTGSGQCSIILYLLQRRDKKKDGQTEEDKQRDEATKRQSAMLLGLGHDRIVYLGSCYVERGYITQDEYENLHELNYLACLLSELDQSHLEKFEAVINSGEHTSSVADLINLTQNLDCFEFYSDVHSDEELGRLYVLEFGGVEVPEHLIDYIDYEAYGRDVRINESGHFAPGGYVFDNGSRFIEHYSGREDIPDEHKVFSMPKLNIREQMAAYKEIIDRSSLEGERLHPRKEVPER